MPTKAQADKRCPDGRELVTNGRSVDFGVEDVAGLAAGAAHEHGPDAVVHVTGDRPRALGRLVVGMGVHGEHA